MNKEKADLARSRIVASVVLMMVAVFFFAAVAVIHPHSASDIFSAAVLALAIMTPIIVALGAFAVFLWGCCTYAKAKGYSAVVGVMGLVPFIGWIALYSLPDNRREGNTGGFPVVIRR